MKKVLFGLVVGSLALSTSAFAQSPMPKSLEKNLIEVCEAVKSDNKLRLTRTLRQNHLTFRQVAKDLKCNGQDVVTFARANEASDNADYVEHRAHLAD